MRWPLALVACVFLLAGCTSSSAEKQTPPTATYAVTSGSGVGSTFALTNTVHLLAAPHVAATLPPGLDEVRTPVHTTSALNVPGLPTINGNATNSTGARWELPRPAHLDFITGTAVFFVEFQGTTANPDPSDACYWRISLIPLQPASTGGASVSTGEGVVCLPEPQALPTGIRQLNVTFPGQPIPSGAGERLVLTLTSSATMTPGSSIVVLSGTPEHDSKVTLNGLQVPLDVQTYL